MNEREQNWQSVVDAWQSSHLSGAAFCREHGLSVPSVSILAVKVEGQREW